LLFFFLFIFFVEHLYFPISSFFTTHCKIITSHRKDVFVSEIIFKIKKKVIFIYIFYFLWGHHFENFPKNITRYKGRGEKKKLFSLSVWVSLWSCNVWLFYTVVDNVRSILIQNTNGNLHWESHNLLNWHCFVFLLFFQKTIWTSLLHKEKGGGILHSFKWGSSTSRSNPLILYPFSKPLESSFKISFRTIYQNPLILAHESKWEILELEEGKSLKERFPYPFIIHLNSTCQKSPTL